MIEVSEKAEMKKLSEITPYDKNPRKNDKTVELLCKMIPKVGFNVPIVIDEDGVIVKGHARYIAAKKLGLKEVPCITTHADPETVRADRIADNKVQEFSKWNMEGLMHEVDMLDLDYDLSDMGLPKVEFKDIPLFEEYEEEDDVDTTGMTDEERRQRYLQFIEEQSAEEEPVITTEGAIRAALQKQKEVPKRHKQYVKCVCKRCGHVFYFDKNVYYSKDGTTHRFY